MDDLLLLAALAANVGLVVFARPRPDGSWSARWYGQAKDPQFKSALFDRIAASAAPVEIPSHLEAATGDHDSVPESNRWFLGVAVRDWDQRLLGVLVLLDPWLRSTSHREDVTLQRTARRIAALLCSPPAGPPAPTVEPRVEPRAEPRAELRLDPVALRRGRTAREEPAVPRRVGAPNAGQHFLRTSDVAARFDVSERTVTNWVAAGKVPSIRTAGGHLRYRPEDIDALVSLRR